MSAIRPRFSRVHIPSLNHAAPSRHNHSRERILLPRPSRRGRRPPVDLREILNAIRYMARSGGGWRMLPTNFGSWQTVYWGFAASSV
jgi:transposase